MAHYRFYRLLGNRIIHGEDLDLPDDEAAQREAAARLDAAVRVRARRSRSGKARGGWRLTPPP